MKKLITRVTDQVNGLYDEFDIVEEADHGAAVEFIEDIRNEGHDFYVRVVEFEGAAEELAEMVVECNGWDGSLEHLDYKDMGVVDELMHGMDPWDILRAAHFGDFNPMDDYFILNGLGNLDSVNEWEFEAELKDNADEILENYFTLINENSIDGIF